MFNFVLKAYGRLLIFALGLLAGIQVPSLITQYEQRVDAHFREVSANIRGFQLTADALFNSDLDALVEYYRNSDDPVFTRDADSVQNIVDRYRRISAERAALEAGQVQIAWHLLAAADDELLSETLEQYNYTVPLNLVALQWGIALSLLLILATDLGWLGCAKCVRLVAQRGKHSHKKSSSTTS